MGPRDRRRSDVRSVVAAALLVGACSGTPANEPRSAASSVAPLTSPSPDHSAFVASVDALAADALQREPIAGLSIAVFQHGRPVLAKGYGHADRESGVPATPETSYPIASVSKRFTAAAILRLADQGKLGLDDPLSRFFPAARPRIGVLKIRHLLNHTSGLTVGGPAPRAAALSVIARGGTARGQGEYWDYSNYNFSLLGLVVEQASGRSYAEYVRDELAVPLGLTGTGYCEDGSAVPGRGRDYLSSGKTVDPTAYWTEARFFAAGGLCSTVLDLVRWEKALEEGRIVSPAMVQAMHAPTRLPEGLEADYGYGTRLGMTGRHRKLGHTGGGQGNKAVLARYTDDDVTVAVLLNTERTNAVVTAIDLEDRIERMFFGLEERSPGGDAAPVKDLQRYAGRYRDGGRLVHVVVQNGALALRTGPRSKMDTALIAQGGDVFRDAEEPSVELRFQLDDDKAKGYGRYHNGWFVGLGRRADGDVAGRPGKEATPALAPAGVGGGVPVATRRSRRGEVPGYRRASHPAGKWGARVPPRRPPPAVAASGLAMLPRASAADHLWQAQPRTRRMERASFIPPWTASAWSSPAAVT